MARSDVAVHTEEIRAFRRELKATDREAAKAFQKELRAAVAVVAVEAAATAPRRSGALARSYRPFTRGNTAGVRSPLPYAPVIEYGGTIYPKGAPIAIRKSEPVTRAVERRKDQIVDHIGDAIEEAAVRVGWND